MTAQILTQARLLEVIHYDLDTGVMTWVKKTSKHSSTIKIGAIAGTLHPDGYIRIKIDGGSYLAHRLVWLYVHGYMPRYPETEILHDDQNGMNNILSNLRLGSHAENMQNKVKGIDNTSGVVGVRRSKTSNKWKASINVNGKSVYLGRFDTLALAATARKSAEHTHGYHPNHGK